LTSASESVRKPSGATGAFSFAILPVALIIKILPQKSRWFNSMHVPPREQFNMTPLEALAELPVVKLLQATDICISLRIRALFSMNTLSKVQ
jgi:hypothetical protein